MCRNIYSVVNRIIIQRYTHLMNNIETNEVKCHVFSKNQNYHKYLTLTRIQIDNKRNYRRAKERENAENLSPKESEEVVEKTPCSVQALAESDQKEKERKPLLEVSKTERLEGMSVKGKQQRKK